MPRPVTSLLLATVVCLGATACGSDDSPSAGGTSGDFPMTVQNCGREVTLEAPPQELYVIGAEAGSVVAAAGGADRISTFTPLEGEPLGEAEEQLADLPGETITNSDAISREVIIGAQPDLLVTFGLTGFTPEDLAAAGIPTLVLSGYCGGFGAGQSEVEDPLADMVDDVRTVGRVLDTGDQADAAAEDLQGRIDTVAEQADQGSGNTPLTAAVFAIDPQTPLGAYGSRSMIHQQLGLLGLENVFADTSERYFEPSPEALAASEAEQVIALYEAEEGSEQDARDAVLLRPELAALPAVQGGDVLALDFYYSGHGTLAVEGLEALAEQLAQGR